MTEEKSVENVTEDASTHLEKSLNRAARLRITEMKKRRKISKDDKADFLLPYKNNTFRIGTVCILVSDSRHGSTQAGAVQERSNSTSKKRTKAKVISKANTNPVKGKKSTESGRKKVVAKKSVKKKASSEEEESASSSSVEEDSE
ncbi:hypothetical protein O3M35_006012 [Rhynocoris fuscipes]|uniref:Uncharacterized protein n=1 Tax=Rhynocoris fuscipes TaxID=488301 RepID=A0AAW1DBS2_9HEMI